MARDQAIPLAAPLVPPQVHQQHQQGFPSAMALYINSPEHLHRVHQQHNPQSPQFSPSNASYTIPQPPQPPPAQPHPNSQHQQQEQHRKPQLQQRQQHQSQYACKCSECSLTVPARLEYLPSSTQDPQVTPLPPRVVASGQRRCARLLHHPLPSYLCPPPELHTMTEQTSSPPLSANSSPSSGCTSTPNTNITTDQIPSFPTPRMYLPSENSLMHLTHATLAFVKAMATKMFLSWGVEGIGLAQHYTLSQLDNSGTIPELMAHTVSPANLFNIQWPNIHTRFWVGPNPMSMPGVKELTYAAAMTVADAGIKLMLMGYPGTLESLQPHRFESVPTVIPLQPHHPASGSAAHYAMTGGGGVHPVRDCRRVYGVRIHDKYYSGGNGPIRYSFFPDLNLEVQMELLQLRLPREDVFLYSRMGAPQMGRTGEQRQCDHDFDDAGCGEWCMGTGTDDPIRYSNHDESKLVHRWLMIVQQAYMLITHEWLSEYQVYLDYHISLSRYIEYQRFVKLNPHHDRTGVYPSALGPPPPPPHAVMENSFKILRILQEVAVLNEMVVQITKPSGTLYGFRHSKYLGEKMKNITKKSIENGVFNGVGLRSGIPSSGTERRRRELERLGGVHKGRVPPQWAGGWLKSRLYREVVRSSWEGGDGHFALAWPRWTRRHPWRQEEDERGLEGNGDMRGVMHGVMHGGREGSGEDEGGGHRVEDGEVKNFLGDGTVSLEDLVLKGAGEPVETKGPRNEIKRWPIASSVQAMVQLKNWHPDLT